MKLKVYNIAAMALALITLGTNSFAQGSVSSSSTTTKTTPPAAVASVNGVQIYTVPANSISINGAAFATTPNNAKALTLYSQGANASALSSINGVYFDALGTQDSAYVKKMKKLQEQMGSLQKEMSALRTEEYKRAAADRERQLADRFKDSERKFATKFSGSIFTNRYSSEQSDADLAKKIESGEVKLKTKNYSKSYSVDAGDNLKIDNKFGKVTINAWNKNEVKVDVEIKAYANDDDKATELLDAINIDSDKNSDGVSFTTKITEDRRNNFWGTMTSNGKTTIRKTVINYTVYMPSKNSLTISNSYGAVILPDMNGKLTIKNQFGNLVAKTLTNTDNNIEVKYGSANIESLTGSNLAVSFGVLNLESANNLKGNFSYTPVKIGKLSNTADIKIHFGEGIQIATLDKNLKTLQINSSYAPVKLAALNGDNADFNVTTSYGGFTYDNDRVSVTSKSPSDDERSYSNTKTYKGKIGKGDSDKVITIKSNFSNVKFDQ